MKSFVLTLSTLFIVVIADAQIPAGTKLFGGSFGFGTQKQEYSGGDNHSTFISISPTFGKAIKENVLNGISLSYNYSKNKSSGSSSETHSAGLNFFRQKYLPIGKTFMAFGEGRIGGQYGQAQNNYRTYSIYGGLGAGIAYNASQRMLLTLSMPNAVRAYVDYNSQGTSNNKISSFSTGINTSVSFQTFQFGVLFMRK